MAKFKLNIHLSFIVLSFALFFVVLVVPKVHGQVITSHPWLTTVGHPSAPPPRAGGKVVHYYQADQRWSNACSYGWAICGPTSIAMIMSTYGVVVTPLEVDTFATQHGMRACGNEPWGATTAWDRFFASDFFAGKGLHQTFIFGYNATTGQTLPMDLKDWKENFLDKGALILASVSAHIFVIDDIDLTKNPPQVHLVDPAVPDNAGYSYWAPATAPWIFHGQALPLMYAYAINRG